MPIKSIDVILNRARSIKANRIVAVAAAAEEHTLEAVLRAYDEGIAEPLLIGNPDEICRVIDSLGHAAVDQQIIPSSSDAESAQIAVDLCHTGKANLLMKGRLDSSMFLRPVVQKNTGLKKGLTLSHVAFFEIPLYHKILALTDSAVLIKPDLAMKASMLENALNAMVALGFPDDVKVAAICAVEKVNHKMPETEDAVRLKEMWRQGNFPHAIVEGPISFDLATDASAAGSKQYKSPVAGDADLLLMPEIAAANALAKSFKLASAKSLGLVAGGMVPIALNSRSGSALDKYLALLLISAMIT